LASVWFPLDRGHFFQIECRSNSLWRLRHKYRSNRLRLEALVKDCNTPQKQAWRASIVLLSAAGVGTVEIMRRTGKSKTCVWRWQERFAVEGFA
jgi:hypothetical protein